MFNKFGNFLFDQQAFQSAGNYSKLSIKCLHCGKVFKRSKKTIENVLRTSKRQYLIKYCDHDKDIDKFVELSCDNCGKKIIRTAVEHRKRSKNKHVFCDSKCMHQYYNTHNEQSRVEYKQVHFENVNGNFLFDQQTFEKYRTPQYFNQPVLPVKCINCQQTFYCTPHQVQNMLANVGHQQLKFCSSHCSHQHIKNTHNKIEQCAYCGKQIIRQLWRSSDVNVTGKVFCSNQCCQLYNNQHNILQEKLFPNNRSRLEQYLELTLPHLFPDLQFKFNDRTTLGGLELDILIPSLNIAFELNGIFHYDSTLKMYNDVHKRDLIKYARCNQYAIKLYTVDCRNIRHLYYRIGEYYLQEIINTINKHYQCQYSHDQINDIVKQIEFDNVDNLLHNNDKHVSSYRLFANDNNNVNITLSTTECLYDRLYQLFGCNQFDDNQCLILSSSVYVKYVQNNDDGNYQKLKKSYQDRHINLIVVYQWEYQLKQDKIINLIYNHLKLYTNVIYARKCNVAKISSEQFNQFCTTYHLHGTVNCKITFGLFYNDELVSVIGFGKSRYDNSEYELYRYCVKSRYQIIGGFSKLIKHSGVTNFISYIDYAHYTGNGYTNTNFQYISTTPRNYVYIKDDQVLTRLSCQKHKLSKFLIKFNNDDSEYQNMINNNYTRIYDCGNLKVRYTTCNLNSN